MYFGSVRFFKHLIITVVILMIAVPAALAVCLGIGNAQKEAEIEELKAQNVSLSALVDYYNGKTDYTAEEFITVFEQLGIDKLFVDEAHEFKNLFAAKIEISNLSADSFIKSSVLTIPRDLVSVISEKFSLISCTNSLNLIVLSPLDSLRS